MSKGAGRISGCNWQNFFLKHEKPALFVTSQWAWPQGLYVLYRLLFAIYWMVWIILSGVNLGSPRWFLLLTNWALFLLTFGSLCRALTATHAWFIQDDLHSVYRKNQLPWFLKMQWVIYNISLSSGFIATVLYWVNFFEGSIFDNAPQLEVIQALHTHGINMVFLFVDLFITATPIHFLHVYHSLIYSLILGFFIATYHLVTGIPIYSQLDWDKNFSVILPTFLGYTFLAVPGYWLIIFGLYQLRLYLNSLLCCACRTGPRVILANVGAVSDMVPYVGGGITLP